MLSAFAGYRRRKASIPVPVRLSGKAKEHPDPHSDEWQARTLHVEPVLPYEYNWKGLER